MVFFFYGLGILAFVYPAQACPEWGSRLPEFIETSEGLFPFIPTLFDNAYHLVGDSFTTAVDAKNVGFQKFSPAFAAKSSPLPLPKGVRE